MLIPFLALFFVLGGFFTILYWKRHCWLCFLYGSVLTLCSTLAVPWFWNALLDSGKSHADLRDASGMLILLMLVELAGIALLGSGLYAMGKRQGDRKAPQTEEVL